MTTKIGLSTKVVQDRPLMETVQIAGRCGYTGLELFGVPNHLPADVPMARVRDLRRLCDDLGVRVVTLCTYVGGFAESGDREAEAQLEVHRRYVEVAQLLNCDMIRLWPDRMGRSIQTPREDHWLRAAHYLRQAADLGLREGTRVLIENHVALSVSPESTLRLLRLIDRPNVVVNFDPGNMRLAGQEHGRAAVLRLAPFIGNVQVKEVSREMTPSVRVDDPSVAHGGTADLLIGEGDIDHASYLRPLVEVGYDGYYMAECHKLPTPDWPSDRIAAFEFQALSDLLAQARAGQPVANR